MVKIPSSIFLENFTLPIKNKYVVGQPSHTAAVTSIMPMYSVPDVFPAYVRSRDGKTLLNNMFCAACNIGMDAFGLAALAVGLL